MSNTYLIYHEELKLKKINKSELLSKKNKIICKNI